MIKTYQRALKFLLEQRVIQPQHQKWIYKLLGYDFEVCYQPGRENLAADALSRAPPNMHVEYMKAPSLIDVHKIQSEIENDAKLATVIEQLRKDPQSHSHYTLQQGILKFEGRLVLPKSSSLIPTIVHTYHDSILGGHSGFLRTYKRVIGELFWEGMKADIKKYVDECVVCQRNKTLALAPAGLLLPLGILDAVWEEISIDFIEGLPKAKGFDTILVIVDRLSKSSHFINLKHHLLLTWWLRCLSRKWCIFMGSQNI